MSKMGLIVWKTIRYMKRSKRSFVALQIGQIAGALSRAAR